MFQIGAFRWCGAVLAATLISFALPTSVANATTGPSGTWYWDALKIQAAHDAGFTGKGVTIAIIDSTFNPSVPTLQDANIVVPPSQCWDEQGKRIPATSTSLDPAGFNAFHGTNVASLIVGSGAGYPGQAGVRGVAPGAKLLYYSGNPVNGKSVCLTEKGESTLSSHMELDITDAIGRGADIIAMSLGGNSSFPIAHAIAKGQNAGVIFVIAYPNTRAQEVEGQAALALSNGAITVGSTDSAGSVSSLDGDFNLGYSEAVDVVGPGVSILAQGSQTGGWQEQVMANGTSMATPIVASFLALTKQKYPNAKSNQLIQTLLRNTGIGSHDLIFDRTNGHGYGIVSLTSMLSADPTEYPDLNPLIEQGANVMPPAWLIKKPISLKEFRASLGAEPSASATPPSSARSKSSSNSVTKSEVPLRIIGLLLGTSIVLFGGLAVLLLQIKKRRRPPSNIDRAQILFSDIRSTEVRDDEKI